MKNWSCNQLLAQTIAVACLFISQHVNIAAADLKCGGLLGNNSGIFQSPSYPYDAPTNINCTWELPNSSGKDPWIYVMFEEFALGDGDSLSVMSKSQDWTFVGVKAPFLMVVESQASILFKTSSENGTRSFSASYNCKECRYTKSGSSGLISSPLYPQNVTDGSHIVCSWIMVTPPKTRDVLSFVNFSLKDKSNSIQVFDGISDKEPLLADLTGDELPPDQVGNSSHLTLVFKLNPQIKNVSFLAEFMAMTPECSVVTNVTNVTFTVSPPQVLQGEELNCLWILKAKDGSIFLLNFEKLELKNVLDMLVINNGLSKYNGNLQTYTVNQNAIPEMTTSHNELYIFFSTKQITESSTFSLKLDSRVSGGSFMNSSGNFSLDPQSRGKLPVIFNFLLALDKKVEVTITNVTYDNSSEIVFYDILPNNERVKITSFINGSDRVPIFGSTNKMMIEAKNFVDKGGFQGIYNGIPPGCNQFDGASIGSYQLLKNIISDTCTWLIRPQKGNDDVISFNFNTLNLGKKGSVKMYSGMANSPDKLVEEFNSSVQFYPYIQIASNEGLRVDTVLSKNGNNTEEYVRMSAFFEVIPGCKSNVKLSSGNMVIKSPGYPTRYPINAECNWQIIIPEKKMLLLSFNDVDIYPSDSLLIYVMNATKESLFFNLTGTSKPDDIILTQNVTVKWSSVLSNSVSDPVRGFNLELHIMECGGNITDDSGNLDIPGKSFLNGTVQCIWIIDVANKKPKSTDVYIVEFNYKAESGGNASKSAIEVYNGGTLASEKFMFNSNNSEILSRTNRILVKYAVSGSATPNPIFAFTFKSKACDKAHQCKNGICMHDSWRCNGENNCGDYSDEDNCNSPPAAQSSGVSGSLFAAGIILALIAGVGLTLVSPFVFRKIKGYRQRYSNFHTLPEE